MKIKSFSKILKCYVEFFVGKINYLLDTNLLSDRRFGIIDDLLL